VNISVATTGLFNESIPVGVPILDLVLHMIDVGLGVALDISGYGTWKDSSSSLAGRTMSLS
jgi:hypothetical protein